MNDTGGGPGLNRGFTDELDARGTFNKAEAKRELGRLNRSELEGRLGLSQHKVEEILTRAEKKSKQKYRRLGPGDIHYKVFLGGLKVIKFSSVRGLKLWMCHRHLEQSFILLSYHISHVCMDYFSEYVLIIRHRCKMQRLIMLTFLAMTRVIKVCKLKRRVLHNFAIKQPVCLYSGLLHFKQSHKLKSLT